MYSNRMNIGKFAMDTRKILIVDDDAGLRDLLQEYLATQGFEVAAVADGVAMEIFLQQESPHLMILDLMLPGEDGLSLARKLRAKNNMPIIILSARGEEADRIVGLEVGADDYLAKPFNPRELLARIRSVLRRKEKEFNPILNDWEPLQHHFGEFVMDLNTRTLSRRGEALELTAGEFYLLRIFAEHANRVLNRDQIMDKLKGYERSPFDRSIDVRITRLRRKMEADPSAPVYIRTVWGEGYMFTPSGKAG